MVCYYPLSQSALGLSHATAKLGLVALHQRKRELEPQIYSKVVVGFCV